MNYSNNNILLQSIIFIVVSLLFRHVVSQPAGTTQLQIVAHSSFQTDIFWQPSATVILSTPQFQQGINIPQLYNLNFTSSMNLSMISESAPPIINGLGLTMYFGTWNVISSSLSIQPPSSVSFLYSGSLYLNNSTLFYSSMSDTQRLYLKTATTITIIGSNIINQGANLEMNSTNIVVDSSIIQPNGMDSKLTSYESIRISNSNITNSLFCENGYVYIYNSTVSFLQLVSKYVTLNQTKAYIQQDNNAYGINNINYLYGSILTIQNVTTFNHGPMTSYDSKIFVAFDDVSLTIRKFNLDNSRLEWFGSFNLQLSAVNNSLVILQGTKGVLSSPNLISSSVQLNVSELMFDVNALTTQTINFGSSSGRLKVSSLADQTYFISYLNANFLYNGTDGNLAQLEFNWLNAHLNPISSLELTTFQNINLVISNSKFNNKILSFKGSNINFKGNVKFSGRGSKFTISQNNSIILVTGSKVLIDSVTTISPNTTIQGNGDITFNQPTTFNSSIGSTTDINQINITGLTIAENQTIFNIYFNQFGHSSYKFNSSDWMKFNSSSGVPFLNIIFDSHWTASYDTHYPLIKLIDINGQNLDTLFNGDGVPATFNNKPTGINSMVIGRGDTIYLATQSKPVEEEKDKKGVIIGSVIGSVAGAAILAGVAFYIYKKRKDTNKTGDGEKMDKL